MHETIDAETIIIDLSTGSYYSLRGSAPAVWSLLLEGRSESDVVTSMQERHTGDPQAIREHTLALIEQLLEAGLIEGADAASPSAPPGPPSAPPGPPSADRVEFEPPLLETFGDMKYFLLLDPIHEVEEGGWPRAAAAGAPPAAAG